MPFFPTFLQILLRVQKITLGNKSSSNKEVVVTESDTVAEAVAGWTLRVELKKAK